MDTRSLVRMGMRRLDSMARETLYLKAGLDWTPRARTHVGLSLYRTRVQELIVFAGPLFDAINIARHTLDLLPPEKDAVLGSGNLAALAQIQAQTGATAEAVENLKKLLSIPAGETISIARLKIDPVWNPIRNDPGFQELLTMKEYVGP